MRQAMGSTWVLQLVIIFMLLFVAFLAVSINYTKAYKIKNQLLTTIEQYEGVKDGDGGPIQIINNYLIYNNYSIKKSCENGEYGVANLETPSLEKAKKNTKYYYCVGRVGAATNNAPNRSKYTVRIFFKFNLPVIGELMTFTVTGETININKPTDNIDYLPR